MISKPWAGWCNFDLDNFHGRPSYLTNVPIDILESFINYWENGTGISIYFDEEGSSFNLVVDPYNVYIIECKDEPKLIISNKSIEELTAEVITDIENDFQGWCNFDTDEEAVEEQTQQLEMLLNKLKQIFHVRYHN